MFEGLHSVARLGLLGDAFDPIAQLLEDLPGDSGRSYLAITDPAGEQKDFDALLVLTQSYALAHLPALVGMTKPCHILLRRPKSMVEEASWLEGLELLSAGLALAGAKHISLVALTDEAAIALTAATGRTVSVIGRLRMIEGDRPTVPIRRDEPFLIFSTTEEDGTRSTRQARRDVFSWVRLRRLGSLFAADPSDQDMADVVAFAEGVKDAPSPDPREGPPTMIVVVPNGVGLGHVTRMMAIAKALNRSEESTRDFAKKQKIAIAKKR